MPYAARSFTTLTTRSAWETLGVFLDPLALYPFPFALNPDVGS